MLPAEFDVRGKVVFITGAGRGIGKGIALELARAGCRVAVNHIGSADEARLTVGLLHDVGFAACTLASGVGMRTKRRSTMVRSEKAMSAR